jgi:hypothetical protein
MPTAIYAALGVLSAERAGAGSGLMQAVRQVGGTLGVAVLGTVLDSGYHDRVQTGHLPAPLAQSVHASVAAGVAVARELHDDALGRVVRVAFAALSAIDTPALGRFRLRMPVCLPGRHPETGRCAHYRRFRAKMKEWLRSAR